MITRDNASNNKIIASELYYTLKGNIAHILNLIVKDILQALKPGSNSLYLHSQHWQSSEFSVFGLITALNKGKNGRIFANS
ncbi:predicted protein [Aspergillus nidulans FGSC A4]|uniref:Uncharacterized protein n=1 Tax=Emericella nidulans (strain FGSC A4 / ATCC 38163 / CBS 112.46 / NRRL 194 / M139) TaxID=227321 RepID=Q5AQW8_EMENI|nr:hypothetical protein [Aspergillus nidulans FGSC A4]EAA66379.1 predicted protein [Aspergillus nidulans FGSC A4]CBF87382.1 TPA: hypothetical protein ANIA_09312 [Aspergillus nidulans FGSC A4]|eukprot:XP_682581.1 predicted protein [Aspergillus nidulans FGSC A4]